MNSINVIQPYKYLTLWVFDDERVGLIQEPFVAGADDLIDLMVASMPNSEKGFILMFSKDFFPGFQYEIDWRREEAGGNWYYSSLFNKEGWLCPALLKYFDRAPEKIYLQCKQDMLIDT